VDGVLIFNIWSDYTDRFLVQADSNMQKAVARWKNWFGGELHAGPFNTHCIGHGSLKNWCLSRQPSPWMQPLPECTYGSDTSQDGISSGDVLTGGGIVSEADEFHEFSNSDISPYQRKWMISGAVLIPLVLLLCAGFVCWKCERRRSASRKLKRSTDSMMEDPVKKEDQDTSEESPMTEEAASTDKMQPVRDDEDDDTSKDSTAEGQSTDKMSDDQV
jgi:hypothetical protein